MFKLFLFLVLVAIVNCLVPIPEKFQNAKPMYAHPRMQKHLKQIFPKAFNSEINPFIIGGSLAQRGQIPHQILIFITYPGNLMYLCGGSLIDRRWILTAAHCVYGGPEYITIFTGVVSMKGPASWGTVVEPSDFYIHPEYNDDYLWNDIALVELTDAPEQLLSDPYVDVIQLPIELDVPIGSNGTISGFGRTSDDSPYVSDDLKYNILPVISNQECASYYVSGAVRDTNICGGTTPQASTCGGDSGGPFSLYIDDATRLIGVTSFGASLGCQLGYPAGFTRVASFSKWIDQTINKTTPPPEEGTCGDLKRLLEEALEAVQKVCNTCQNV